MKAILVACIDEILGDKEWEDEDRKRKYDS